MVTKAAGVKLRFLFLTAVSDHFDQPSTLYSPPSKSQNQEKKKKKKRTFGVPKTQVEECEAESELTTRFNEAKEGGESLQSVGGEGHSSMPGSTSPSECCTHEDVEYSDSIIDRFPQMICLH